MLQQIVKNKFFMGQTVKVKLTGEVFTIGNISYTYTNCFYSKNPSNKSPSFMTHAYSEEELEEYKEPKEIKFKCQLMQNNYGMMFFKEIEQFPYPIKELEAFSGKKAIVTIEVIVDETNNVN